MKLHETQLLPFGASELPDGPWLVFAPHADDETFGMGGSIILAGEQGIAIDVVFMTDGAQATPQSYAGSRAGNREEFVLLREREARTAGAALGVRRQYFLRAADRELTPSERIIDRVAELIAQTSPASVFFPSCLELHPDHRCTAEIVWAAVTRGQTCPVRMISYEILYQGPCNMLLDISAARKRKRDAMHVYASQSGDKPYIEQIEHLNAARGFSLAEEATSAEGFYAFNWFPGLTLQQATEHWLRRYFYTAPDYQPLVSVIVRTKNRRRLLNQALASLAHQDYRKLEVLVINDGGEDVADLLEAYRDVFPAIQYANTTTAAGRAAAANAGMERADGELFMFLDDDDWFAPAHIANLVRAHAGEDILVAYSGVKTVHTDPKNTDEGKVFNTAFDRTRMYSNNFIPIHAALVRRSVIDQGYRFDESLEMYEDWDFWLQLCQLTPAFKHLDAITAFYRVGGEHGFGLRGGSDHIRRRIYARWAKTWGISDIEDILSRLAGLP